MLMPNGAVLPHGLLGHDESAMMNGFNKSYKNFPLRMGIVTASYPVGDEKNAHGLTPEYDVMVFEQHEDKGATTITYKNCMSAEGFGSIADYFEANLRPMKKKTNKGSTTLKGQNGAIVLLLCLDGMSDKGIIIKSLTHPDRKSNLTSADPHLEGEYNGVHVVVNADGSTSLTFKGATDNDGKVTDSSQGDTVMSIEKDGSFQIKHKAITQRLEKGGKASLTADDDISLTTKTNLNVTTTKDVVVKASGNFTSEMSDLTFKASGSALLQCQKLSIEGKSEIDAKASQINIQAESMASIKGASIVLDGLVSLGGQGGTPLLLLSAQMLGIGNLGAPVISTAISGFTVKVTAT